MSIIFKAKPRYNFPLELTNGFLVYKKKAFSSNVLQALPDIACLLLLICMYLLSYSLYSSLGLPSSLPTSFLKINFYQIIVDLQSCVTFCYTVNQIYIYIYIYMPTLFQILFQYRPDKLWTEVHDTVQETGIKIISPVKKCKNSKWLSDEAFQVAVKEEK